MGMKKTFTTACSIFLFFLGTAFAQQVAGERELPLFYTPGADLDVLLDIDVEEGNEPNGLIINETPPSGWSILESDPPFESVVDGTYKWIFYGGNVNDSIIAYTVSVPSTSSGEQVFSGKLKYNDSLGFGIEEDVSGDTSILTATPSQIAVAPPALDFGTDTTALVFTVTNTGGPNLAWNAETTQGWLSITRTSGILGSGEAEIITANVDRSALAVGTHLGSINFTSTGGNATIPVTMIVGELTPVQSFQAFPSLGGILLVWENPVNYTGTIIFRRIGSPMTGDPQNGIYYGIPGNPDGYLSTVGGGTCLFKDSTGASMLFDDIDTDLTVYYRIYSYSDLNYSTGLFASSTPTEILDTGVITNFLTDYGFEILGTGTPMDNFEALITAGSLTGTLPANLDFGYVADPTLAPEHPGLKGFANIYGLAAGDLEILPGMAMELVIPVYQADLDAAGAARIRDLRVYQWNSNTKAWTRLEVVDTETTDLDDPVGFITVEVTELGELNYFALGTAILVPGGSSGCFIATAAYGTDMAEEVVALKRFRDERLEKNAAGRAFIRWYYRHSPPAADFIRGKNVLKATVRVGLKPLIWLVK